MAHTAGCPIAVIDIGSNSGRVVVVELTPEGHLAIVADARSPLRLARDVAQSGRLGTAAIERTIQALRDFQAVARGAGAERVAAVATAAVRTAEDRDDLVARIREETGLEVDVIDGVTEASYAFLGAVHGLPVEHGLLVDMGGGSMDLSRFRDRRLIRSWSLPLGALLLSDRFLISDPPENDEVDKLRVHVEKALGDAGVPALAEDEQLVGTGGTIRNLASIDERRHRYSIPHLHGYRLSRDRLDETVSLLVGRRRSKRRTTPGLNADRVDSILGGAIAVQELVAFSGGPDVTISGQGLREGVALSLLREPDAALVQMRTASVDALCARFSTWSRGRAVRRAGAVGTLLDALAPEATAEARALVGYAASILDLGRSIDYYERHRHAADVVLAADLAGFSHSDLAFVAEVLRHAGGERPSKAFRPLLSKEQRAEISQAGVILALADEIERRTPPGLPVVVSCRIEAKEAVVASPVITAWRPRDAADRFAGAFHRKLVVDRTAP